MNVAKASLFGFLERFAGRLRFPQLFAITLILFVVDLIVPDLIPFADEVWESRFSTLPRQHVPG